MSRFPIIAAALAFVLDIWIFGQPDLARLANEIDDPEIDLELYCSVFGLDT